MLQLNNFFSKESPYRKCKLCSLPHTPLSPIPFITKKKNISNGRLKITEKVKSNGNYTEGELIYVVQSLEDKLVYTGHTGKQLHHLNRPDKNRVAKLFYENHDINFHLNVTILQKNIKKKQLPKDVMKRNGL